MASLPPAPAGEHVSGPESAVSDQESQVSDALPPPISDLRPLSAAPPDPQPGRETDRLFDALKEPVRRRLLVALCAAGGAYVSTLCQRVGLHRNLVSRHLGHLRMLDLVLDRREGQHVWYGPALDLVRYETHAGRYTLTIIHPSGEGLAVFGTVAGVMGTTQAAPDAGGEVTR